jgi:putative transposase
MLRPYDIAPNAIRTAPHRFRRIRGHDGVDFVVYYYGTTVPFNPNRHHRRSIRLDGYDYRRPGAYFTTICTHEREPVLAEIHSGTIRLSKTGQVVVCCWLALPRFFPNVELDSWVLMPDHIHGVILLFNGSNASGADHVIANPSPRPNGTAPSSVPAIIQNFKSVSTRKTNQLLSTSGARLWQRNYFERIIRTDRELDSIRRYIDENSARWAPK